MNDKSKIQFCDSLKLESGPQFRSYNNAQRLKFENCIHNSCIHFL